MNNNDLSKSFDKLKKRTFLRYMGILIERKHGGFEFRGEWYSTQSLVFSAIDKYILEAGTSLFGSINRVNKK